MIGSSECHFYLLNAVQYLKKKTTDLIFVIK